MNLEDLGLTKDLSDYITKNVTGDLTVGRITQEHRERYIVSTGEREFDAEITGNLRFTARSREDYPAVGDWVTMMIYEPDLAIIHQILPRKSVLERQAVGKMGEKQIISANVDCAFIMQSIDNNFSINRLERYLAICYSSGIEPVFIISKTDLTTDQEIRKAVSELENREKKVQYILLSNLTHEGLDQIYDVIRKGQTYCVVGSSGVGKSTLVNNILEKNILRTNEISRSTGKGRHTTDHRELFVLENGGIIIDTPGMRELGITENIEGLRTTFEEIFNLTLKCKFPDCKHINENGCAVIDALRKGIIDGASLENFRKMMREQDRFHSSIAEKRKKDRQFGKMVKRILKEKKDNKL